MLAEDHKTASVKEMKLGRELHLATLIGKGNDMIKENKFFHLPWGCILNFQEVEE